MKTRKSGHKVADEKSGSEGRSSSVPLDATSGIGRETRYTEVSFKSSNDDGFESTLQNLQALQKL